jgi:hypothetical protein
MSLFQSIEFSAEKGKSVLHSESPLGQRPAGWVSQGSGLNFRAGFLDLLIHFGVLGGRKLLAVYIEPTQAAKHPALVKGRVAMAERITTEDIAASWEIAASGCIP